MGFSNLNGIYFRGISLSKLKNSSNQSLLLPVHPKHLQANKTPHAANCLDTPDQLCVHLKLMSCMCTSSQLLVSAVAAVVVAPLQQQPRAVYAAAAAAEGWSAIEVYVHCCWLLRCCCLALLPWAPPATIRVANP